MIAIISYCIGIGGLLALFLFLFVFIANLIPDHIYDKWDEIAARKNGDKK
jgi:F0F1-type ATP synthase membrane subunit a